MSRDQKYVDVATPAREAGAFCTAMVWNAGASAPKPRPSTAPEKRRSTGPSARLKRMKPIEKEMNPGYTV